MDLNKQRELLVCLVNYAVHSSYQIHVRYLCPSTLKVQNLYVTYLASAFLKFNTIMQNAIGSVLLGGLKSEPSMKQDQLSFVLTKYIPKSCLTLTARIGTIFHSRRTYPESKERKSRRFGARFAGDDFFLSLSPGRPPARAVCLQSALESDPEKASSASA